ncbi:N-acetylmannosamine-6-phosphate 2-epimerase [Jiangella gansuensis]|uniref:N-acetylmannosamine-6-phosphate 2-epimerase n=1 Tax=Jiangella gansuensis TaxID=281473 RepID=UPI00047A7C19|nr:putative N-acetylmannosamine-6-phosphate 2-epimerase [Jiangella gansuensis]
MNVFEQIRGRLVVSCQAGDDSPFADAGMMRAMAQAAVLGGAAALRVKDVAHVRAVRDLGVPVIGLVKRQVPGSDVYITPAAEDARRLADAGADIIAADGTDRPRPGADTVADLVVATHAAGAAFLADVDGVPAARHAVAAGADAVSTTLAGYTAPRTSDDPDLAAVGRISGVLEVPVLAEGRYTTPEHVRAAFAAGAWSVVVGTAISDPVRITQRFTAASLVDDAGEK